jgi:hypothetical protein
LACGIWFGAVVLVVLEVVEVEVDVVDGLVVEDVVEWLVEVDELELVDVVDGWVVLDDVDVVGALVEVDVLAVVVVWLVEVDELDDVDVVDGLVVVDELEVDVVGACVVLELLEVVGGLLVLELLDVVDVVGGLVVVELLDDVEDVDGLVVVEVLDVDEVVGGLVDDDVVVGGGSVVAEPAGCGPVASNEPPSARSTRVIVAPKHPPSLATTCTVASGTFSSCAAMPVGMAVCCLPTLLPALSEILPRPARPPMRSIFKTPSADALTSLYRYPLSPICCQHGLAAVPHVWPARSTVSPPASPPTPS